MSNSPSARAISLADIRNLAQHCGRIMALGSRSCDQPPPPPKPAIGGAGKGASQIMYEKPMPISFFSSHPYLLPKALTSLRELWHNGTHNRNSSVVLVIRGVKVRLKPKAGKLPWQLAEHDFRQYRDRRLKITLPRLTCLEEGDQQSLEA